MRLSIGLEDADDLIRDLDWALGGDESVEQILSKLEIEEKRR